MSHPDGTFENALIYTSIQRAVVFIRPSINSTNVVLQFAALFCSSLLPPKQLGTVKRKIGPPVTSRTIAWTMLDDWRCIRAH